MSTNEQYPVNDGGNSTSEQIPHSGVHGFETPVTEFDNTSLQDAHDQGLLEVPENPSSLTKESRKRSPLVRIGLVLGGLATVAGLGVGAKAALDGEAPESRSETGNSATPNTGGSEAPSESPTVSNPEVIDTAIAPTELTVDRYKDGESLARAFTEQLNGWINAGGTQETIDNEPLTANTDDYLAGIAAEYDQAYIDALYVSDWASRPELAAEVEEKIRIHSAVLNAYHGTSVSVDPADLEPYVDSFTVTSVNEISNTGDEIVVEYQILREDNSEMNLAENYLTSTYPEPTPGANRLTWVQEDGVWKVAGDTPAN